MKTDSASPKSKTDKQIETFKQCLDAESKHQKAQQSLYYTTRSLMGYTWATWNWIIGSRGRGKSFAVLDTALNYVRKYGQDNVKIYYFRISDLSIKAMLANQGAKCVDSMLVKKYNLCLSVKSNSLYNNGSPLITFYPLVSAAKIGKGLAEFDPDFLDGIHKRYIFIIIDEFMMAEGLEKKSVGNPVEQFKIYIENILRDQQRLNYPAVKVFGCANAVSECSDFLAQLAGFIPEKPGRYKLKRRHMIIDMVSNSKAYIEKRKKSYGADIMDYNNDANYTNIVKRDIETLMPKTQILHKVTAIIKFSKNKSQWYTLWDNQVIKLYSNQTYSKDQVIAMRRYLDEEYQPDRVLNIFDRYDSRGFMYSDLISQSTFAANLRLLKK